MTTTLLPILNATLDRANSALTLAKDIQELLWRPTPSRFTI